MSTYDLLRKRCGLSQQEAADFHGVRLDTVHSWCADRRPAKLEVLAELRQLYRLIERAGGALGAKIDALKHKSDEPLELGLAQTDAEAKKLGFPCVGAHEAALGLPVARLHNDTAVTVVPLRKQVLTATAKDIQVQERITVYHFRVWDQERGENIIPPRKSPAKRIEEIGGELIPDTAEEIDVSALDLYGRYDPTSET